MVFKLRANFVKSKELTVEANDLMEAVEKAEAMMAELIPVKELTTGKLHFDVPSDIKWADESKFRCKI